MGPTGPEFSEVSSLNLLFGSIEIERLMRLSWYIQVALRLVSAYIFSWTSVGLVVVFVVEEASWTVISRRLRQSFINFRADQNSPQIVSRNRDRYGTQVARRIMFKYSLQRWLIDNQNKTRRLHIQLLLIACF